DPVADLDTIEAELAAYAEVTGADMAGRPRIVALNKVDVPEARAVADRALKVLAARGLEVHEISAATHEGGRDFAFAAARVGAAAGAGRSGDQPSRRGRTGVRGGPHRREQLRGAREQAGQVGAADRLQQRRGGRLPQRPAGQDRGGAGTCRGGGPGGSRGGHRG